MKITDIKTYCVEAVRRNWVFLEVETDAGITGVGEVSSTGFAKTMEMAVWDFKRLLIGENPLEVERLWEYLYRRKFWRQDLLLCTALSGIEMALWDIKGKECGKPVYELLGGPTRPKVKAYANYWFMGAKTVSDYAKMAAAAVEKGYTALKWSPFGKSAHSVTSDELEVIVECVKRVREAVGPRIDLLLDAHGRFNLPTAKRVLRALEEYDLFFVEEALPPENIDAFVEFETIGQSASGNGRASGHSLSVPGAPGKVRSRLYPARYPPLRRYLRNEENSRHGRSVLHSPLSP